MKKQSNLSKLIGYAGDVYKRQGQGHAVPHHVDCLAVQFKDLVVPVDDLELHVHAQALSELGGHVGVKADPVAVGVLIVHGLELGDAHYQGALVLNIGQVAAVSRTLVLVLGAGGQGKAQAHSHQQSQQTFLLHLLYPPFASKYRAITVAL